ncbi:DUF6880 family protein [Roseospira goensis]|uniref:Uncharacterized protein n=1 Tax=Roseospira goensis TaxID=391922 RepID=A0A7W6WMB2_9PROT|nr:DUF6880 family protein [Roseospira goensis]MBB4287593.1 hypothetical protein [Roseospira goensis]
MPSKKTLNAQNLEALGAEKLAELLLEVTTGNAAAKRRLRLALADALGPAEVAREVRKRLGEIARGRRFIEWSETRAMAADLESHRVTIVDKVGGSDPVTALDLTWRFLDLGNAVYARCDDSSGVIADVFRTACGDLGRLATAAGVEPVALADRTYDALCGNDYGLTDNLIPVLAPALGRKGLEHLKGRIVALSNTPVPRPADKDRVRIGWSSHTGAIYEDEMAERSRQGTVRYALQAIADAQGDVDAFIAQYDPKVRKVPQIAAEIAQRLIAADRADEALRLLDNANTSRTGWPSFDWDDARIAALEALDRPDDAQAARWTVFERSLSSTHLRDYLSRLPDFEDLEAEEKALDYAERVTGVHEALWFLVHWPALDRAARLVLARASDLDGNHYHILTPAADALAGKHPLAATLLLRAMIDFALGRARNSRYRHAARHLMDCAGLATRIEDFGAFETHVAYEARLRRDHGRKTSFWNAVESA